MHVSRPVVAIAFLLLLGSACSVRSHAQGKESGPHGSVLRAAPAVASPAPSPSPSAVVPTDGALSTFPNPRETDLWIPSEAKLPAEEALFKNTYYYMVFEAEYDAKYPAEAKTFTLRRPDGSAVATVSERFRKDLTMEGSGQLADGRAVNVATKVDGEWRFNDTVHPFGRGAGNCDLVPFKSIAVDPREIPLGSVVYIDETQGMRMPDGTIHNGVWYAEDTGGAIQAHRIDLFVGHARDARLLTDAGIDNMEALKVRILRQPSGDSCVHHFPQ